MKNAKIKIAVILKFAKNVKNVKIVNVKMTMNVMKIRIAMEK